MIEDLAGNDLVVPVQDDTTVTVTASDTTAPTLVLMNDGDVDNIVAANVSLTYTITFSEDINEATVTAADFVNSGTATIAIGTITETSAGVFTVVVTPTTGGTLTLQIPTGAVISDLAGNNLVVPVSDDETLTVDATAPTLTSIVDNVSGGPVSQNQPITYTITFSEDINLTSVSAADFENAGTATITVGAITEPTPGVLSVVVSGTSAGTIQLRIPSGATITDVVGNSFTPPATDDTSITVNAVTTLAAGDVAVIGYNTNGSPDTFAIVFLKDLIAGTSFFVNDNEIATAGGASFTDLLEVEAQFTVKPGQTITAGTVVILPWGAAAVSTTQYDWSSTSGAGFGNNNEEIYIYTAPSITSTTATAFIYGAAIGGSTSAIPVGLTDGTTFIKPTGTASRYKTTGALYNDSQVNLLAAIGNVAANWEAVAPGNASDWTFSVGNDTSPPTVTFDDGDADDSIVVGATQTYTLTFNEDILNGSFTAADLDNAGSSSITIGTITETSAGVFTVQVTPTTAGTIILRIPTGSVIEDVAGNDLVVPVQDDTTVAVTASDTTAPTLVSMVDGDVDNLVAANVALTYTITFSEDINEATVNATDFANDGTATITIGAITETSPGVFTVIVTPTTGGTLTLQIPASAVISDLAGNNLVVPVSDNETLTVDATAPSVSSIADNVSGGPVTQFQAVTYTLTFSEDVNLSTVTAVDFANAGTATVTIGAIAEPSPGVVTVIVTPQTSGTLILQIPSTASIADVVGNTLTGPINDDTTITVTAVTTLTAGDIAFTGIQTDTPDTFSFVLLKEVVAGTTITFTDNGWGSNGFANTNENIATVTFNATYAPGTHFVVADTGATGASFQLVGTTTSAGTVAGNLNGLAVGGDSILAYQGAAPTTDAASNWIAGINTRSFAASPTTTNQSNLPSALVLGVSAIQLSDTATDIDNAAYKRTTFGGTVSGIRSNVNNIANWTTNTDAGPLSTTVFTIGVEATDIYISEVTFAPLTANDKEYIELRGTPNAFVPANAYLLLLEGDSAQGPGTIDQVFSISGMKFGSNGYLVLRQAGSTFTVDAGATDVLATGTDWGTDFSSRSNSIEDDSVSVLIVQTPIAPIPLSDVDAVGGTGDAGDGVLDGAGAAWTIRDSLGNIDGGANDTAYGRFNTSGNGQGLVPPGSLLIDISSIGPAYHPDYMARNAESTGYLLSDWVFGELAGSMPNYSLATGGFTSPSSLAGAPLNNIGKANSFGVANQAPTDILLSNSSVAENAGANAVVGTLSTTDPNSSDTFSYTLVTGTGSTDNASFNLSGNTLRATSSFNFETKSSYGVRIRTTDAGGLFFEKAFVIAVNNVNELPVFNPASYTFSVAENSAAATVVGTVSATDPDTATTLTYSLSGVDSDKFVINASSGQITVAANANLNFEVTNQFSLTASVTDGTLIATAGVTINVTNVNETPVFAPPSYTFTLAENSATGTAVGTVAATDPENNTLTFTLTGTNASYFAINASSGAITVAAGAVLNFEGVNSFSLTAEVTDGNSSASAPVTINLTNVNETPVFAQPSYTFTLPENSATGTAVGTVAATDPENNTLTFTLSGTNASYFAINASSGAITVAAGAVLNFEGVNTFNLTAEVTDGNSSASAPVTINLTNVNEAPVFAQPNYTFTLAENSATGTAVGTVAATDPENNSLTFSLSGTNASYFAINASTGAITVAAGAVLNFEGVNTFNLTAEVTDGNSSASAPVTINLTNVNEAPTSVTLAPSSTSIAESASTSSAITLSTISVADDALGTNALSLTGADAASFEIVGTNLRLRAGVTLDFETKQTFNVTVNVDDAAVGSSPDAFATFVLTITNATELSGIDVQNGQTQRSFVRNVDVIFDEGGSFLNDLVTNNRLQLTRYDLNGLNGVVTPLPTRTVVGNEIQLDFGSQGIGGNRNSNIGDGYYELAIDMDGNGSFETKQFFHRLLGDINGNGAVENADKAQVLAGQSAAYSAENDVNGDGVVNVADTSLLARAFNRKLKDGLLRND